MSDLARYYDESYPPSLWGGGPPPVPIPDPTITSLTPNTAVEGSGPLTVTVTGTNYRADSVVEADQAAIPTTFVSATSLTSTFDPTTAGTVIFTVRTGGAGGEESNPSNFTVTVAAAEEEPEP